MILSLVVNGALAISAGLAVLLHTKNSPAKVVFRYFTVLSNTLCAAAALGIVIGRLWGSVPQGIVLLKFVGTAAVTVTFLTVMLFLGPCVYDYKVLLTGPDLWLHLICPLLAILSCCLWDKAELGFGAVFLGTLPVVVYGGWYIYHVVLAPPEKRWEDFYGFNRGGKWPLSYAVMTAAAFLISLLLWLA